MFFVKMQKSRRELILGCQLFLFEILVQRPQLLIIEADRYVYLRLSKKYFCQSA